MRLPHYPAAILPLLLATVACSSDPNDPGGSENGADGGSGGTGGEGTSHSGGSLGSGGEDSSSTGGTAPGTGGSSQGTGGDGTGGGDPGDDVVPSPGCGNAGRPDGGTVYNDGGSPLGPSWLIFPEKYDGNTPLPVLFGFHGCGGGGNASGTPFFDITRNSGFETDYIVAAPVATSGGCYDYGVDMPKAKALYTELIENHCVDLSRVFATGHSYGAGGMVMALTASSNVADFEHFDFKAIVPVAGWPIFNQSTVVPTMYIQGVTDAERDNGDGKPAVDKIVEVNQCDTGSTPYPVDACNSKHDGDPVNAGCRRYEGCSAETIWCSHDDSDYGGTFHGIPCFYQQAMYDFFAGL